MNFTKTAFALAALGTVATAELKVATVNIAQLFDGYYKTAETQKVVNLEKAKMQKENDSRLEKIRGLKEKHDKLTQELGDPSITEKKKIDLMKEFEQVREQGTALERERMEYIKRRTAALNEKAAEDARAIFGEISEEITLISEADGYDVVLNKQGVTAKGVPIFLYANETLDITPKIKAKLDEKAPK